MLKLTEIVGKVAVLEQFLQIAVDSDIQDIIVEIKQPNQGAVVLQMTAQSLQDLYKNNGVEVVYTILEVHI